MLLVNLTPFCSSSAFPHRNFRNTGPLFPKSVRFNSIKIYLGIFWPIFGVNGFCIVTESARLRISPT